MIYIHVQHTMYIYITGHNERTWDIYPPQLFHVSVHIQYIATYTYPMIYKVHEDVGHWNDEGLTDRKIVERWLPFLTHLRLFPSVSLSCKTRLWQDNSTVVVYWRCPCTYQLYTWTFCTGNILFFRFYSCYNSGRFVEKVWQNNKVRWLSVLALSSSTLEFSIISCEV